MIFLDWMGEGGDPYWGNVILLLHADDTPGTTLPVDSSSFAQTLSIATAGLQTTAVDKKYGAGSLTSIAAGFEGRLAFVPGSEGNSQDWTIEFWWKQTSIGNQPFGFVFSSGNGIIRVGSILDGSSREQKILLIAAGAVVGESTTTIALNTWYHIAVSRSWDGVAGTTRLFIDGVKEDEVVTMPALSADVWRIGQWDTAGFSGVRGYVDDFRITTVARYTADFTPPAKAFPNGY